MLHTSKCPLGEGDSSTLRNSCICFFESEWKGAEGRKELPDLLHGPEEVLSDHAMFPSRLWLLHV